MPPFFLQGSFCAFILKAISSKLITEFVFLGRKFLLEELDANSYSYCLKPYNLFLEKLNIKKKTDVCKKSQCEQPQLLFFFCLEEMSFACVRCRVA